MIRGPQACQSKNYIARKYVSFFICVKKVEASLTNYSFCLPTQVRDEANKAGVPPARESIWQYFVNKCANNLHIVLAMSPVGDTLRTRCRNFPGLVNNCSIDWFTAWPQQALHAVASVFLGENVSWPHLRSKLCLVITILIFFFFHKRRELRETS